MNTDTAIITIKAGSGGDGVVRFRREKYVPNGGPNGGDGGNGGVVVFQADQSINTLIEFQYKKKFEATDGADGEGDYCNGKNGTDVVIKVPCGTLIREIESGKIIADMYEDGSRKIVLQGGKGGRGNAFFKTSTRQAPMFSQQGEQCKYFRVRLELKTIADVALIGKPNVGKSTILSIITNAKPKIANYDFTTLSPNLGIVKYFDNSFTVADIPGLIEGASAGAGLGHDFLRHIERTRVLVHVVDISDFNGHDAVKDYLIIQQELANYGAKLTTLPQIVALSKIDLVDDLDDRVQKFVQATGCKSEIIPLCAIRHENVEKLVKSVWNVLKDMPIPDPIVSEIDRIDSRDITTLNIVRTSPHEYRVSGGLILHLQRGIVFDDYASSGYFMKKLKENGVFDKLRESGAEPGDSIMLGDLQFEFID